jgi:glycosyltransferase involved in cell wall biosynthesis
MLVCHMSDGSLAGHYFRNIADGLTKAGIGLLLVDIGTAPAPTWLPDYPGVRYRSLGAIRKAGYLPAAVKLARLLNAEKVDILHTHLFYSGLIGVLARKLARKTKVVLMRHHTSVVRLMGSRLHVAADRWMAEQADHVLVVSEAGRRYMLEVDGIAREDIEVVHIGLNVKSIGPDRNLRTSTRREFGFADDDFVIGYVGNLLPRKGHIELVEAFGKINAEVANAKLLLVCRGKLDEVNAAIARMPQPGRVILAGWRDDSTACYNVMDVFVQPSLSEAFSQVLLEAMAVGLPAVATDVGGAREVIESGENGMIVPPGDPASIAREAISFYRDPDKRARFRAAARKRIATDFTSEKMIERHIELYRRWRPDGI